MKAILLAGGQGRRLRSITGSLPKPMVPLVGVPVLDRLLDLLRRNGFTDVCMTLCYRPEVIQEHCGDGSSYGVHLKYRIESEPRGTAGGVRACSDFYGREDFLVISGDAACSFDLLGLYRRHQQADAAVTIALYQNAEWARAAGPAGACAALHRKTGLGARRDRSREHRDLYCLPAGNGLCAGRSAV